MTPNMWNATDDPKDHEEQRILRSLGGRTTSKPPKPVVDEVTPPKA